VTPLQQAQERRDAALRELEAADAAYYTAKRARDTAEAIWTEECAKVRKMRRELSATELLTD
jgi:hypothetical protein